MSITILDGGLATCIEKLFQRHLGNGSLWSAKILAQEPSVITAVHEAFLAAGASIITTATYQASVDGFEKFLGLDRKSAIDVIRRSVLLAKTAKGNQGKTAEGSVGPYGACLADGSEYTGSYLNDATITNEFLKAWHRPRIEALLSEGVDVLAVETLPGAREAEAIADLLKEFPGSKAWYSFSCRSGTQTSYGEDIGESVSRVVRVGGPQVFAVGVNCCSPKNVTESILRIRVCVGPEIPVIVYPNSGEEFVPSTKTFCGSAFDIVELSEQWIAAGATLVGGCCRVYPDDIRRLSQKVKMLC